MPNKRKCRTCKNYYPADSGIVKGINFYCCEDHMIQFALSPKQQEKGRKELKKYYNKQRADKQKLSHWVDLTERSVNAFILIRDKNLPCVSCGAYNRLEFHAGHYLSKGAHPELRFEPDNLQKQCSHCNVHKSGNQALYRIELVKRIGEDRVNWLEGPHKAKNYTREELKEIRIKFNRMKRDLENVDIST